MEQNMFDFNSISTAYERIKNDIHLTPVLTSSTINELAGRKLFFKTENFQKTGSFKARGALNAVISLLENHTSIPGVVSWDFDQQLTCFDLVNSNQEPLLLFHVTHSSGNHGQGLAFAAKQYNVPCTVVVPDNAPKAKVASIKAYGAKIVTCESNMHAREKTCKRIVDTTGMVLVHPHDDLSIMAGQGTMAIEFLNQVPELDAILVSVGGGGMIGGVATWVKHAKPSCKVFGVEPVGKDLEKSLVAGQSLETDHSTLLDTIADGIRVKCLGHQCFPIVAEFCEKHVFTVIVVEPSSAICLAAVLSEQFKSYPSTMQNIGIVLCGGNVDLNNLPFRG